MALAHPRRAADEDRLFALDELASGQVHNLVAVELGVEREVVALQRLLRLESGPAQTQVELLFPASLNFVLQEAFEKFDIRPLFVNGLTMTNFERFQNP